MASGGCGGGGGAGVCNKRYRRWTDDDGETSGRNKRCGVGPCSVAGDGTGVYMRGHVYGEHAQSTAEDDDDGAGEEDYLYGYDDLYDDDEEAEQSEGDDAASSARDAEEQRYAVLTESDVGARQEADTAKVADVLSIAPGLAAVLLRHFKWRVGRLQEEWFTDERRVRRAVGLPAADIGGELVGLVPYAHSTRPQVCGICFDPYPAGRTRSAGCSHYYCDGCWSGYVAAAVGDGARCLSLRCPDPSCSAPVVRELVDAVAAGAAVRARYARFWLRSYVEESDGRIKWCGGAGCTRSVEFLGDAAAVDAGAATDVFCSGCRRGFCWRCGEEAHGPVSCATVRAWLAKNASDSETANWVAAHTKRCPKCRRPIEKNQGCNHMTCGAPCGHQFCWLCFDPWDSHSGCMRYDYRHRQQELAATADEAAARRRHAKASLDRYLYHFERWEGNGKSLQKALADADELERSGLQRMAAMADVPAMELAFLTVAYRQIAAGRHVLRWAHAYAYFLFLDTERDAAKRDLFDDLQSQANRWLECLHDCAELEREELFGGGTDGDGESTTVDGKTFREYKEKVANLTGVTRKFIGNLVKAFKTNLPEVVTTPAFDFERIVNRPTIGSSQTDFVGGIFSTATFTQEPGDVLTLPGSATPWRSRNINASPAIFNVASQGMSTLQQPSSSSLFVLGTNVANDSVQEHRPIRNTVQQPLRLGGHGRLSNLSQFPPMNSSFVAEATSMELPKGTTPPLQFNMSNMACFTSTPSVTFSTVSMSAPGQPIGTQEMVQSTALGSFGSNTSASVWDNSDNAASSSQHSSMAMDQQAGINALGYALNVPTGLHPNAQPLPPGFVKIWEGTLYGQRQGKPVFICKLDSWSEAMSKATVAADWPETMQIVHLIAQEYMNNKQYIGKVDFLIFRTLNQHGFLGQLQEKKLCAVIELPSQTLLLSVSDKAGRMIGMLLPKNMVIFRPKVITQPSQVQPEKLQQKHELLHHHQQLQQQQLLQQQQHQQNIQHLQHLQQQQQQQMQQIHYQQQHMPDSPQNLQIQQQKQHQQQLQHQEQLHLQQLAQHIQHQPPRYQPYQSEQMQHHQQQPRYQPHLRQQMQHQQQLRQQIQPQQQPLHQIVGTKLGNDDDAIEDWVTGVGKRAYQK